MKFTRQPRHISALSYFNQLEQRALAVVVDHHPDITPVAIAIVHWKIVRGRETQGNWVNSSIDRPRSLTGSGMDQPAPDRKADKSGGVVNIELPHDSGPMAVGGLDADPEHPGNFLGRLAFSDQLKHLPFA